MQPDGLENGLVGAHIRSMAARDRFTLHLKCPKCGWEGIAQVSEDDHPYMRDPGFAVDEYPDGFSEASRSVYRHKTEVRCKCGEVFHP
jgi:hypothetical protein